MLDSPACLMVFPHIFNVPLLVGTLFGEYVVGAKCARCWVCAASLVLFVGLLARLSAATHRRAAERRRRCARCRSASALSHACAQATAAASRGGGFALFGAANRRACGRRSRGAAGDAAPAETADGYTLNFDNSPVANVAKVVLGDLLSQRYTIDPRAQGAINLSSSRPIPKRDLLFVLESALQRQQSGHDPGSRRLSHRADRATAARLGPRTAPIPPTPPRRATA